MSSNSFKNEVTLKITYDIYRPDYFFLSWLIKFHGLFNAKAILAEEQQ